MTDGLRLSPIVSGWVVGYDSFGFGFGRYWSGLGIGQAFGGTGSGMVITSIVMLVTGIVSSSGDLAGSEVSSIGKQFLSGSQTVGATDPTVLLAQQVFSFKWLIGRVSVKPRVFYKSNAGVWLCQM